MDVWQTAFKGMYKAASLLAGVAATKAADVPGLFSILTGAAPLEALPEAGVMVGLRMPSLALSFHSAHALVLFNALRAEHKYGDQREQLRSIQEAMDKFIKSIRQAIQESSPVPSTLPETGADTLFNAEKLAAYTKQVDTAIANVRAFIDALDLVLDDVTRCLEEWNNFLRELKKFLAADKPRNIFEQLEHYTLHQERDWTWYKDETGFASTCHELLAHRNRWADLLKLGPRGGLPRLNFDAKQDD